jgi:iron complex outermembrane receptor protein
VTLVRRQTAVSSTIFDYAPPPAGHGSVDVVAGGQWSVMNIPLQFSLRIQNLFDTPFRDYLSRYRYFALNPGRNVTIAVTIPFGMFNNSLEALL